MNWFLSAVIISGFLAFFVHSLRRRAVNLDTRDVFVLYSADILSGNLFVRKLCKMIGELASEAWRLEGKRIRSLKGHLSKTTQLSLFVRHNYKAAVYYEARSRFFLLIFAWRTFDLATMIH